MAGARPHSRQLSAEQLSAILGAHRAWLESGGIEGQRADLSHAALRDLELEHEELRHADLSGADLSGSNLRDARLLGANLQGADLSQVRGLTAEQLERTDLSGAVMPESVAEFDALRRIDATVEIARPVFLVMMFVCAYTLATIISTSDAGLITNAPSELIPDVSTPIPTVGFFSVAPIFLLVLYVYLHFYIREIWQDISGMPLVFPDGTSLRRKVHPWIFVRIVARLTSHDGSVMWYGIREIRTMINFAFVFLVWWVVPLTLLLFWLRYLPNHDWHVTSLHIALVVLSILAGGLGLHALQFSYLKRRTKPRPQRTLRVSLGS